MAQHNIKDETAYKAELLDPDLALSNVIATHALEGLDMTAAEIDRARKLISGELSVENALRQIHEELQADVEINMIEKY